MKLVGESGSEPILVDWTTEPEAALRWEAAAHLDDNTCEPCRKNDGKLYRNRQAAYRDYPDNKGYKKCVGAKYGNNCRCRVRKRGKGGTNVSKDLAALIDRARTLTAGMSAILPKPPENSTLGPGPREKLRVVNATSGDDPVNGPRNQGNAIYIYSPIGGWDGIRAIDVAMALADMSGPVDVHLNSPGGFIFEGSAVFNAFQAYTGGPIAMHIDGYAASAASFIAMAASPHNAEEDTGGIRIARNALMMIHDGMGGAIGTAEDLRDVADLLDMLSNTIADTYARRAGGTAEEWREVMMEGDTWYDSQGAIEAHLADVIMGEAPAEPEPATEPDNVIRLFDPAAVLEPAARADIPHPNPPAPTDLNAPQNPTPKIDIEGLHNALKGAFQ